MSDYKITREEYEDAQNVVCDYEEQLKAEANGVDKSTDLALHKHIVMPRFVYRLVERGQVRTYEIGECDTPRTYPQGWCDRRVCEGFWGDEEIAKKVVALLNGA